MNAKTQKLSEGDGDALSLARPVRALSGYWPFIWGVATIIVLGAKVWTNGASNTTAIEQIKTERGVSQRVDEEWRLRFDERLRRIEESVATIAERTKRAKE